MTKRRSYTDEFKEEAVRLGKKRGFLTAGPDLRFLKLESHNADLRWIAIFLQ